MSGALALTVLLPLWLPLTVVADLLSRPRRLPVTRLTLFGLCWTWLETTGLVRLALAWMRGRAMDVATITEIQRWWAGALVGALRRTCGLRIEVEGLEAVRPGPVVMLVRHSSLVDALVSGWVVVDRAARRARYVLKRELLWDPCLDVAGNRLPNHFVDRGAADSAPELAALTTLAAGAGPDDCIVIFPEGTRANPEKRARALSKLGERADRLSGLRHLLPPRPAGTAALLAGAPDADVAVGWHVGFEGMDTFGGIMRRMPPLSGRACRFVVSRIDRADVPSGDGFTEWLDDLWLDLDSEVDASLSARAEAGVR